MTNSAHGVAFSLNVDEATIFSGNTTSDFFEVAGNESLSGSAAGLYTAEITGVGSVAANNPPKVEIFFGSNPQPFLTSAFIKAANGYLWWDAADLALFNAGTFTSIVLIQDGLLNNPGNAYHEISHAGLNGRAGESVPDFGPSAILLALGLMSIMALVPRMKLA